MRNYFTKNCSNPDKTFWSTVSPFITDKKTNGNKNILLTNKDETVLDPKCISELSNDYVSSVANGIGFDDDVESAKDAIMNIALILVFRKFSKIGIAVKQLSFKKSMKWT